MKATLAIEVNSPQDFANLSQILASFSGVIETPTPKPEKSATPAKETTTEAPKEAIAKEPPAKTSTKISVEQVRSSVQAKAKEGKREEIKNLLTEFGAENVTALKEEHYNDFLTKLNGL
ncbi:MAG: hypothetical protein JSS64_06955 [Bacteroidetes bacterium]|nr:hypothetical protein [Bacteroidota bacterium]